MVSVVCSTSRVRSAGWYWLVLAGTGTDSFPNSCCPTLVMQLRRLLLPRSTGSFVGVSSLRTSPMRPAQLASGVLRSRLSGAPGSLSIDPHAPQRSGGSLSGRPSALSPLRGPTTPSTLGASVTAAAAASVTAGQGGPRFHKASVASTHGEAVHCSTAGHSQRPSKTRSVTAVTAAATGSLELSQPLSQAALSQGDRRGHEQGQGQGQEVCNGHSGVCPTVLSSSTAQMADVLGMLGKVSDPSGLTQEQRQVHQYNQNPTAGAQHQQEDRGLMHRLSYTTTATADGTTAGSGAGEGGDRPSAAGASEAAAGRGAAGAEGTISGQLSPDVSGVPEDGEGASRGQDRPRAPLLGAAGAGPPRAKLPRSMSYRAPATMVQLRAFTGGLTPQRQKRCVNASLHKPCPCLVLRC